jgi:hypothetical protein
MHRRFYVLQNEAGAGGAAGAADGGSGSGAGAAAGGGEGAGAGAAGAGAAGAGGGNGAAAGAAGGAGTALAAGAAGGGAAAGGGGAAGGAAGAGEVAIPEKFVVKGADGQIDHAATAKKVAEGYTGLEKRLGSGEAPPQTVDGYKVNVPETLKETINAEVLAKDEGFKGFMAKLHAAGASQKVVDAAVGELLTRGAALRGAMPALDAADCTAQLRQEDGWKSDQEYEKQVGIAFNAGKQIFGKDFEGVLKDYGNDPRIIRGLANIGKEMQEDRGPSPEAMQQIQENLDTLMASPAYLNANHPQHASTMAKVDALTKQQVGTRPVNGGMTRSFKTT